MALSTLGSGPTTTTKEQSAKAVMTVFVLRRAPHAVAITMMELAKIEMFDPETVCSVYGYNKMHECR